MLGAALGRYRVIEKIGSGGMGEVYRAHDDQLERDVALKVLPAGTIADEAARKLFRKEALMLAKLNHPSIATIHEFGSQDGLDFLVMELIPGKSLKEILKEGPVPENQLQRLGLQVAEGLAAAHEQGIIHLDLKPANIMITSDGRLKILDFGLAKLVEGASPDLAQSSAQVGNMPGTLPYMAPEQLRGVPVDARTDVYASGAVLYEAATGQRPFPATNPTHLIESVLHRTPQPPCELNQRLSPGMQAILLKALEKDPEHRYRSIQELRLELERLKVAAPKITTSITLELSQAPQVEIAHVLFIDIVQFSMLPMDEQRVRLRELQKAVRSTTEFARAKSCHRLIPLPTGDGMALVFFGDSESPLRCAVELSRALRATPEVKLRMGIHTGPIYRVPDINAARNVAGGGINLAQRVMDCGDAGHILLSKAIADVLMQLGHWSSPLHDLGEVEVKHGVRVHLFNFYDSEVGNPAPPAKLAAGKTARKAESSRGRRRKINRDHSGAGQPNEAASLPTIDTSAAPRDSAHAHSLRDLLPAITRRDWAVIAGILLLATFAFFIARVDRRWFLAPTKTTESIIGVPTDGKYLAVFPFDVQGDVKPIAENLSTELSKKFLALPDMSGLVSTAATEAVAAEGLIDVTVRPEETAGKLGVNRVLHGTIKGTPQKFSVTVIAEDVAKRASFRKEFGGGPKNLKALADQIYVWAVQALNLALANGQSQPASDHNTEDLMTFDLYLKSYTVGDAEQRAVNAKKALQFYEEAVKRNPRSALQWAGLARARFAMYQANRGASWAQDSQIAAQYAERLERAEELPAHAHGALGEVYRETGKTQEAYKHFRRALMLSPNDDLWKQLGRTYEMDGKEIQAIMALENAVTMNPQSERDYNELGNAYFQFARFDMARVAYRHAVEINPNNVKAQMNIGNACFELAKYDEAIVEYKKTLRLGPNAEVYANLGVAYLFLKRYTDAVKMLEQAAKLKPDDEDKAGNLADAYRASGSRQKAAQAYARAIALAKKDLEANPNDTDVLRNLALYYAKTGEDALADHYIREARSINATSPDLLYYQAIILAIAKQPTAALKSLHSALEKGFSVEKAKLDPDLEPLRGNPEFVKVFADLAKQN